MHLLTGSQQEEAILAALTEEVLGSSAIEGEKLDREEVRSLFAWRLGINAVALPPADRKVEGAVEMMLDATQKFKAELSAKRLFGWHASLFPTGRSNLKKITVGAWRDTSAGPMQVISREYGRERVHYEAPIAEKLDAEMKAFLDWYNVEEKTDPIIKAAISHLWFATIHPFEDGNGRIARVITEMSLARSEGIAPRFYSMSAQIRRERVAYYDVLESTQKGGLNVTPWIEWFLGCLDRAFSEAGS